MAAKASRKTPSERDRFWLDHHRGQVASGKSAKAYAAEQGLTAHAFYQARKRLRAEGLLDPAREARQEGRSRKRATPVRFSKVTVAPRMERPRFRAELPNGIALDWSGPALDASVLDLLERLLRLR